MPMQYAVIFMAVNIDNLQMKKMRYLFCSSLRERLRTHKFFTKYQCFDLNYHKFSIKSYVSDVYYNRLGEAILIHIHNI